MQYGINHGRRIGNAFVNLDLGLQQGIGAFDAQGNHDPRGAMPDARYRKYTATATYLQPFKLWGESFSFTSLMTGQHSEDVLFSPQRISLGGQSSIRGYKDQSLAGDSGGYWRNDLRWSRPVTLEWLRTAFAEYGASVGYDQGVIRGGAGAGASICVPPICSGPMVAASASLAASNMNSDYKAVTDQSGLFAGEGGYDINVGKNTLLNGAVIASEASADKNLLSTDRLIVSDIKNAREINAQSASVTVSSGSGVGLSGGGSIPLSLTESKQSNTRSAVSEGTLIVRSAEGANDLVGLNRDTANANQALKPPDEKAIQERMALVQGSVALAKNVIGKMANAEQQAAEARARSATNKEERQAAISDRNSWDVGGDKRILADVAAGLIAVSLGDVGGITAVGVVAQTTANDMFKVIGDYADKQHYAATDNVTRAAWGEGGAARAMLHGLAGAAMGLSSGNPASGALGAGASASLMPLVADAVSKSGLTSAEQKDLNAFIAGGLGALVSAGEGVAGAITAGSSAVGVELFNRQLHRQQEIPLLKQKAAELAKRIGQPRSSARWEDLLLVAAGAEVDAAGLERLTALWMQSGADPESGAFAEDMGVAYGAVSQLAAQKIPLTWSDGQPIVANGAPVYAFGATKEQAEDSTLFNADGSYGRGAVYERWRQYGQAQAGKYSNEITSLSTYHSRVADAAERLSVLAGKGILPDSTFDDALLSLTGLRPAKSVINAVLGALAERQPAKAVGAKGEILGLLPKPGSTSVPVSGLGAGAVFRLESNQIGKKLGKHVKDYGGNAASPADRKMLLDRINDIGNNPEKVIPGTFSGQGANGRRGDVYFRIKGNDVVVTKPNGTFVTILKDGVIGNPSVKRALRGGVK